MKAPLLASRAIGTYRPPQLNAEKASEVRRLYCDGEGIPAIARKLGLSVSEVRQALGRAG